MASQPGGPLSLPGYDPHGAGSCGWYLVVWHICFCDSLGTYTALSCGRVALVSRDPCTGDRTGSGGSTSYG